jgi:hypothetical protein
MKKTGVQKSRETVPLNKQKYCAFQRLSSTVSFSDIFAIFVEFAREKSNKPLSFPPLKVQ